MNKRKGENPSSKGRSSRQKSPPGFYTPFKDLDQHLVLTSSNDSNRPPGASPDLEKPEAVFPALPAGGDDKDLFARAMEDVRRLQSRAREKVPLRPPDKKPPRFLAREELEAYAQLVDLVAGEGPFELSSSDEYIDGAVLGISPEVLKRLREGYFSYQDYLDLHGFNRQDARGEMTSFVMDCFAARKRCILIIPGRGLNSRDKEPVLKNSMVAWLTRAPLKRVVLAFASARSCDGGWGAFYVLLRKNEGKAPLLTPAL